MEIIDGEDLEERRDALSEHPENVRLNDVPLHKGPMEEEFENQPELESEDPNLSAMMAEVGAEERLNGLGMSDENEMWLDEPEDGES